MPTDVERLVKRKAALQQHEERETWRFLVLISVMGSVFTILKAIQSEEFMAALLAFGALE
jgi:hypothetical protein